MLLGGNSHALSESSEVVDRYRDFLILHNKDISRLRDKKRIEAFRISLGALENMPKDVPYHTRINHFADWTHDEVMNLFVEEPNEIPSNQSLEASNWFDMLTGSLSIPDEINWATTSNPLGRSVISGVYNQGSCGMTNTPVNSYLTRYIYVMISLSHGMCILQGRAGPSVRPELRRRPWPFKLVYM